MKKISILVGSLLCILTTSCDKFLELTPRDQKVVSTIEDYRDIMASFMYYLKTPTGTYFRYRCLYSTFSFGSSW